MSLNSTTAPFSPNKRRRTENESEFVLEKHQNNICDGYYRSDHNHYKTESEVRHLKQKLKEKREDLSEMDQKCSKLTAENNDLIQKVNDLEDKIKAKDHEVKECCLKKDELSKECTMKTDELKKLSQKYKEYYRTMTRNMEELRDELAKAKGAVAEKDKMIQSQISRIKSLVEKQVTTDNQLNNVIKEQKQIITQKEVNIESLSEDKRTVQTRVDEEIRKVNKYKVKYDQCRTDLEKCKKAYQTLKNDNKCGHNCQQLNDKIKYLEAEATKLKHQRQYFSNQNEMNKKKNVSNAVYGLDIQNLYANELRKNGQSLIGLNAAILEELGQHIQKLIEEKTKESKREGIQQMADTIDNIREELVVIRERKNKMDQKRADGKVNCCYCSKTFDTTGDLKRHLTVTHKKDTTNLSNNDIEVIEID